MRKYTIILAFAMICGLWGNAADRENIVIPCVNAVYRFKADRGGDLQSVKVRQEFTYRALDTDANALTYVPYNDHVTVDKASAPGAKPSYSQVIGEGIYYEDSRICSMRVPLKVGKDAEVVYERTLLDPAQVCEISFNNIYPIATYHLTVEMPAQLAESIVLTPVNFPEVADVSKKANPDGSVTYNYTLYDIGALKDDNLAPEPCLFKPQIRITGYFSGVDALYAHLRSFVKDEPSDPAVDALAAELVSGITDPLDKIDAISRWVRQNIRYVAIEHGEWGNRPETAANVLANRYGDCKGSANLIKGLLRSAGLDGRLVWIGTKGSIDTSWEQVPSMASGNHMIAACLLPDTTVFIDGTVAYSPARYLPYGIRGQSALVEDGDNYMLLRVPDMPLEVDTDSISAKYVIDDDYVLTGDIKHTFSGSYAISADDAYHGTVAAKRPNVLHRMGAGGRKSVKVDNPVFTRESPDSPVAEYTATITDASVAKKAAGRVLLTVPLLFSDHMLTTVDADNRRSPISLHHPSRQVAEIDIDFGDKASSVEVPADIDFDTPWFKGFVKFVLDGTTLHITASLSTDSLWADASQASEWNSAVRQAKKALSPIVKIKTQ